MTVPTQVDLNVLPQSDGDATHVDMSRLSSNGKVGSDAAGVGAESALPFEQLGMSFSHGMRSSKTCPMP